MAVVDALGRPAQPIFLIVSFMGPHIVRHVSRLIVARWELERVHLCSGVASRRDKMMVMVMISMLIMNCGRQSRMAPVTTYHISHKWLPGRQGLVVHISARLCLSFLSREAPTSKRTREPHGETSGSQNGTSHGSIIKR